MKAAFSPYLTRLAPGIKKLIAVLGEEFDYVSVLSTDSRGFGVMISQKAKSVGHSTMMTERGNVIRVYKDGLYSEYAFDRFDPEAPEQTAKEAMAALKKQFELIKLTQTAVYETAVLPDEPASLFEEMETELLPENTDLGALVDQLSRLSDKGSALGPHIIDCRIRAQSTHVCKMFLTAHRDMRQSYVYSEAAIMPIAVKDGNNQYSYVGISERLGPEIFRDMEG
ncbi:MAG: TldD/PmbA family protein, partial [Lachnospiraceae bacterium]|nr:TldD/PmbA family protein [Lachnospiraceae bacterium]